MENKRLICKNCSVKYKTNSEFRELYDLAKSKWNDKKDEHCLILVICPTKECNKLNMFTQVPDNNDTEAWNKLIVRYDAGEPVYDISLFDKYSYFESI